MRTVKYNYLLILGLLLFFTNILSMQESRPGTPIVSRAPSTLSLEENLGLHIRFSSLENRIELAEERLREYSPNVEQLTTDLDNAQRVISSNNEVIDALHHYQVSVNEIIPFFEKIILSHPQLFNQTELARFGQIVETIVNAEAECKKKIYGE